MFRRQNAWQEIRADVGENKKKNILDEWDMLIESWNRVIWVSLYKRLFQKSMHFVGDVRS